MSGVDKFEDLLIWQMAHHLAKCIYKITKNDGFSHDWGLRDQIRRAVISIMSNIAEGFERYSRQEFKHFLSIARGSCAEVRSQIQLAYSLDYLSKSDFSSIFDQCIDLSRAIGGLYSSLDKKT